MKTFAFAPILTAFFLLSSPDEPSQRVTADSLKGESGKKLIQKIQDDRAVLIKSLLNILD
jgi:hypothetical protein